MPNPETPKQASTPTTSESLSFLSSSQSASKESDATYNEFFQDSGDDTISVSKKSKKSLLELSTSFLAYVIPVMVIVVAIGSFHVFILKGGGAKSIKENYTFLCSYLNYSVNIPDREYKCETLNSITSTYNEKRANLEEEIIMKLNEYIPVKLTRNILITSPERRFVETVYNNKLRIEKIMDKFEEVRNNARSLLGNNINCAGMTIDSDGTISTQCTIYGSSSGNDDNDGKLGSARIEALRFAAVLGDTTKSQFILLNPPTSLSMDKITDNKDFSNFETRTTLSIQAKYVPFSDKN